MTDKSLHAIIQAQIVDCQKTIHYHRLKHRTDQVQNQSKLSRTQSVSRFDPTNPSRDSKLIRRNTIDLQNPNIPESYDSLVATIFNRNKPENVKVKAQVPVMKKKTKDDVEKMEELKISNEAFKNQLVAAFDYIQRLENENRELQSKKESKLFDSNTHLDSSSAIEDDDDDKQDLEDTI